MNKISFKIRVSEIADVAHRLVNIFAKEASLQNDVFLKNLFAKIELQATAISIAIKKETAVSKLEEADNLRDETIINLHNILVGYRSMRTREIKESAEKIYAVFERYGTKITRENYSSESGHIESLLRDLAATDLQEAIGKLSGVAETIEELRTRQKAFHTEQQTYEKALSAQGTSESATALKKTLLELINNKLVYFLIATNTEAHYQNLSNLVAQIINSTNETILRRSKKTDK